MSFKLNVLKFQVRQQFWKPGFVKISGFLNSNRAALHIKKQTLAMCMLSYKPLHRKQEDMVQGKFLTTRSGRRKSCYWCRKHSTEDAKVKWSDVSAMVTLSRGWNLEAARLQGITEQRKLFLCAGNNTAPCKSPQSASTRTRPDRTVQPRQRKKSRQIDLRTASQRPAHLS